MTPRLPANPMTITPPVKMARTSIGVWDLFIGRTIDEKFFADVRQELQNLRDWDNYERCTTLEREKAKATLNYLLQAKHSK